MIYQSDNKFLVIPFKAIYQENEEYILNKEEFENNLLMNLMLEDPKAVLPEIIYEDISLTIDQQKRYEEVKNIEKLTLDEVRNYVVDGTIPENPVYRVIQLENLLTDVILNSPEGRIASLESAVQDLILGGM